MCRIAGHHTSLVLDLPFGSDVQAEAGGRPEETRPIVGNVWARRFHAESLNWQDFRVLGNELGESLNSDETSYGAG